VAEPGLRARGVVRQPLVTDERLYTNRTIFEALWHAKKRWQTYAGGIPQVLVRALQADSEQSSR
jgi:hypothetical protein